MSEKILQQPAENKLLGLEIMRFFSALSILIWHYQHFAPNNFIKEQQPLYPYLSIFYEHGSFGVYVFYCISQCTCCNFELTLYYLFSEKA